MRRFLVIGSGGREHAIVWRLHQDVPDAEIYCAPGNAGIGQIAECMPLLKAFNIDGILRTAKTLKPDLTIIGPEAPLVAGVADFFVTERLPLLGPSANAARTEGSKVWFKDFLARHDLPTAPYAVFAQSERSRALDYIRSRGGAKAIVLKADGLCGGGKGVRLPETEGQAMREFKNLYRSYGDNAEQIIVEDRLQGIEYSVIGITDDFVVYPFPFTQDYKRTGDGGVGLNTGGMGAHTISLPIKLQNEAIELLGRVVYMLAAEETLYRGFIYLGLMNTSDGLQILECNCRLGDPEAQVILASTGGNFAELCVAAAAGDLTNVKAPRQKQEALCVVLASAEYPASSSSDNPIVGIEEAERRGAIIFHASTALRKGNFTTNKGGRILNSVGRGKDISEAYQVAYGGAHAIQYDGKKFRNDIGNALVFV